MLRLKDGINARVFSIKKLQGDTDCALLGIPGHVGVASCNGFGFVLESI